LITFTRPAERALILRLVNRSGAQIEASARARAYSDYHQDVTLTPHDSAQLFIANSASGDWYDIEVTTPADPNFAQRFAGHIETGAASFSDPLIGAAAPS